MNLLLDTCAILFLSTEDPCVGESTRSLVEGAGAIYISAISSAEMACLQERGRIELPGHWKPWLRQAIERNAWAVADVSLEIMEEAYSLPGSFHADPADRILVATARMMNLCLLTTDRKILDYPHVKAVW